MGDPEKREPQPRGPRPGGRFLSDVLRANIRTLRDARGLSQQDLADRMAELGHSWYQTTAGRVERGARAVSVEEAGSLAAALETTVVGLLDPMAGEAPEDFDLGRGALDLLPSHAARRLILDERKPWDTAQRASLVVWSGNKVVNVGIPVENELESVRRDLEEEGIPSAKIELILRRLRTVETLTSARDRAHSAIEQYERKKAARRGAESDDGGEGDQ